MKVLISLSENALVAQKKKTTSKQVALHGPRQSTEDVRKLMKKHRDAKPRDLKAELANDVAAVRHALPIINAVMPEGFKVKAVKHTEIGHAGQRLANQKIPRCSAIVDGDSDKVKNLCIDLEKGDKTFTVSTTSVDSSAEYDLQSDGKFDDVPLNTKNLTRVLKTYGFM